MTAIIVCTGSYGALTIGSHTGAILNSSLRIPVEYRDHSRADIAEVAQWYSAELGMKLPRELDITEIGWWLQDGSYLAPAHITRARLLIKHGGKLHD